MSNSPGPQSPVSAGLRRLWFVGAVSAPLNGQSNYNRAMRDHLITIGAPLHILDTGGTGATKLRATLSAGWALLIRVRRDDRAYLSVPGQGGVWLFAALVLILRLRGIEHYIHHHSFRPINRAPSRATQVLVAIGGKLQCHVLLSNDMRRRFADLYLGRAGDDRAITLSNAFLFGPRLSAAPRPDRPVTLGHLSVLTREKGVAYLLALFADLVDRGHDWQLIIAGPCADPTLAAELTAAVAAFPRRIDYRGSVAGGDKERFFADIDLFVLPTTLIDEAEPLVMLEAFGRGVEVMASATGCIRDRIRTPDHLLALDKSVDAGSIECRMDVAAHDWTASRAACVEHARAIKALADVEAAAFFPRLLRPWPRLPSADRL